jgi:hypothetical protein
VQAGRREDVLAAGGVNVDGREGLVAQAVTVFQQDQVLALQRARLDIATGSGQGVTDGRGGQDLVVADAGVIDARANCRAGRSPRSPADPPSGPAIRREVRSSRMNRRSAGHTPPSAPAVSQATGRAPRSE